MKQTGFIDTLAFVIFGIPIFAVLGAFAAFGCYYFIQSEAFNIFLGVCVLITFFVFVIKPILEFWFPWLNVVVINESTEYKSATTKPKPKHRRRNSAG